MRFKKAFFLISIFVILSLSYSLHGSSLERRVLIKNNFNYYTNRVIKFNSKPKFNLNLNKKLDELKEGDEDDDNFITGINYKGENLIRRAEILFFGSLTIISFMGWLVLSAFNMIIYDEPFGVLKRNQFLSLYLGSSIIALSVSLSDLFIRLRPLFKRHNVEIY